MDYDDQVYYQISAALSALITTLEQTTNQSLLTTPKMHVQNLHGLLTTRESNMNIQRAQRNGEVKQHLNRITATVLRANEHSALGQDLCSVIKTLEMPKYDNSTVTLSETLDRYLILDKDSVIRFELPEEYVQKYSEVVVDGDVLRKTSNGLQITLTQKNPSTKAQVRTVIDIWNTSYSSSTHVEYDPLENASYPADLSFLNPVLAKKQIDSLFQAAGFDVEKENKVKEYTCEVFCKDILQFIEQFKQVWPKNIDNSDYAWRRCYQESGYARISPVNFYWSIEDDVRKLFCQVEILNIRQRITRFLFVDGVLTKITPYKYGNDALLTDCGVTDGSMNDCIQLYVHGSDYPIYAHNSVWIRLIEKIKFEAKCQMENIKALELEKPAVYTAIYHQYAEQQSGPKQD
jgi:hypothetical protein